ncbi:hypothetical protein DFH28DRAFT_585390 [Melampsora americana]|nr:hypothetical protein DFH28DRAFT_585390 [Melampsora americana]
MMLITKTIILFSLILKVFNPGLVSSLAPSRVRDVGSHGITFEDAFTAGKEGYIPKLDKGQNPSEALVELDLNRLSVKKGEIKVRLKSCLKKKDTNNINRQVGKDKKKVTFSDPVSDLIQLYPQSTTEPEEKRPNLLSRIRLIMSSFFQQTNKSKNKYQEDIQ